MTLLYYLKPIYPPRGGRDLPLQAPPAKKRRKTYEIIRTKEKPSDSRAIEALAEGLISEKRKLETALLKAEQRAKAKELRQAQEAIAAQKAEAQRKLEHEMRLLADQERIRSEHEAMLAAIDAAIALRKKHLKELREQREASDLHEILELLELDERMMH